MQLIINLPNREETLGFHRQRWVEASVDPQWAQDDRPMELNEFGQMIVHPFYPAYRSRHLTVIAMTLAEQIGGHPLIRCGVLTIGGVRAADVAWRREESYQRFRGVDLPNTAPEICVALTRENEPEASRRHKRMLYFEAGAIECWQCDTNGKMTYYLDQNVEQPNHQSKLCPEFPAEISD